MFAKRVLVLAAVIVSNLSLSRAVNCEFNGYDDNGNYVSYDMRPLVSPTTYIFRAKIGSYHYRYHGQQYDYLINICDDVHPDAKHDACNELAHAPAYQVTAPPAKAKPTASTGKYVPPPPPPYEPACYRIADSGDVKFDFINSTDPEEGVKITYRGGQKCRKRNTPEVIKETNETWREASRVVEIQLTCDREMGLDDNNAITDLINSGATIQVEEKSPPDECEYVVQWRTPHGCPYGSGFQKAAGANAEKYSGVSMGVPGQQGWFSWLLQWGLIGFVGLLVVLLLLCITSVKKRVSQYQRGDFNSFGDFMSYLLGDVQVRLQQLMSNNNTGLPTSQKSHMHSV